MKVAHRVEQPTLGLTAFRSNKTAPTATKARGGYYTPAALADYLCRWAIRSPSDRVIEPSCGDGSFVSAAAPLLGADGSITAVEIVPEEIRKAQAAVNGAAVPVDWQCADFFEIAPQLMQGPGYDAAVGNPPFIRFQYFDKQARERAFRLLNAAGYRPNGLANAWVAFVQLAAELVRDGGRLAMVVPAELLQVQYAAELRERLPTLFDAVWVIAFDRLVFPDIQQEVLLLLGDGRNRNARTHGRLYTRQVADGDALLSTAAPAGAVAHAPERRTHAGMKWTSLFLEDDEFGAPRDAAGSGILDRLGALADVDVGIVTGRNSFFVVTGGTAQRLGLDGRAVDVVGRTAALKSIRFTPEDLLRYGAEHRSKLIDLNGQPRSSFSAALDGYISSGEAQGVDRGYKCRIRAWPRTACRWPATRRGQPVVRRAVGVRAGCVPVSADTSRAVAGGESRARDVDRHHSPRAGRRRRGRGPALRVDGELAHFRLGGGVRAELWRGRTGAGAAGSGAAVGPVSICGRSGPRIPRSAAAGRRSGRSFGSRRPRPAQARLRIL